MLTDQLTEWAEILDVGQTFRYLTNPIWYAFPFRYRSVQRIRIFPQQITQSFSHRQISRLVSVGIAPAANQVVGRAAV